MKHIIIVFFVIIANLSYSQNSRYNLLTHSLSQEIEEGNTLLCNDMGVTHENSYYRVFNLSSDFEIHNDWRLRNVEFAIEKAVAGSGNTQEIKLKFFVMSEQSRAEDGFKIDSLTKLGEQIVTINNSDSKTIKNVAVIDTVIVPKNKAIVVEIFIPENEETGNSIFIGSNSLGQTSKTYIRASSCGVETPKNVEDIYYPETMIILNILGSTALD